MSFVTPRRRRLLAAVIVALSILWLNATRSALGQDPLYDTKSDPKTNRHRGQLMLEQIQDILERKYYDRTFHGINLKQRFKEAADQIKQQDKNWQIMRTIAQVLIDLNDSHTMFFPPDRSYRVEYGFSSMIIGNRCFVVDVRRGSDAEEKGLKPGDEIIAYNGLPPTRDTLWVVNYLIYALDPQTTLTLKVSAADKQEKEIVIKSRFLSPKERKEERRKQREDEQSKPYKCVPIDQDLIACKLRTFEVEKRVIDALMKEVGTSKKLILDLRGNGGGLVSTMNYFAGRFFEKDVLVGSEELRDSSKQRSVEGSGAKAFKGEVVVLIDSDSASASEVFSRLMQLEKRGRIIGDTSAGAVMTSVGYAITTPLYGRTIQVQGSFQVSYMSVSVGDLVMRDGNRLERVGVLPDKRIGPTPEALMNKSDPVLAYAAELLGGRITPEKAGTFYFLIPKSEDAADKDDDNGDIGQT
jgi:C-terminal processing protease CtpA/Prc